MRTAGNGASANLTSSSMNISGFFASQIFDAEMPVNWTNITVSTEAAYGMEIGRSTGDNIGDGNNALLPYVNTSGLVLLYHFNNESAFGENDSLVYDFSRNVNSEDNETNNGTCAGTTCPIYNSSDKKFGTYAMNFDGTDDFVNITDSNVFDFGNNAFAISLWAKFDAIKLSEIVSKPGPTPAYEGWQFALRDDSTLSFSVNAGGAGTLTQTSDTLTANNWYHIVMSRASSGQYRIYINGAEASYSATSSTSPISNPVIVAIGRSDWQNGWANDPPRAVNGSMDEVAIWNRSLSADEILNLYKRGAVQLNLSVRSCHDSDCTGLRLTDDSDADFNLGTFSSMKVQGTGTAANLTSSSMNTSGSFASRMFDALATANWTNMTISTEAAYGMEIGRSTGDNIGDGFSITDDSLVTLADGSKKKIKDIKANDYVQSLDENTGKIVAKKVNALVDHGIKPIRELKTISGRSINTTTEHPYLVKLHDKELCDKYAGNIWNKEAGVPLQKNLESRNWKRVRRD